MRKLLAALVALAMMLVPARNLDAACAGGNECSSKINSYAVLNRNGASLSKVNAYVVLCTTAGGFTCPPPPTGGGPKLMLHTGVW